MCLRTSTRKPSMPVGKLNSRKNFSSQDRFLTHTFQNCLQRFRPSNQPNNGVTFKLLRINMRLRVSVLVLGPQRPFHSQLDLLFGLGWLRPQHQTKCTDFLHAIAHFPTSTIDIVPIIRLRSFGLVEARKPGLNPIQGRLRLRPRGVGS